MEGVDVMDATLEMMARDLADAMRDSEDSRELKRLRAVAYEDETNAKLLDEYQKLQIQMQRGMVAGGAPDEEDMQRFQRIASLLMMNQDAQAYLICQMRVQQTFAQLIQIISEGAGLSLSDWAAS